MASIRDIAIGNVEQVVYMLYDHMGQKISDAGHEVQAHLREDLKSIVQFFKIVEKEEQRTEYLAEKYLCAVGTSKDAERRWIVEDLSDMGMVNLAIGYLSAKYDAAEKSPQKDLIKKNLVDLARDCKNQGKIMTRAENLAIRCIRESNIDELVKQLQAINGLDLARKYLSARFIGTGETVTNNPKQQKIKDVVHLLECKKREEEIRSLVAKYLAIGTSAERVEMLKKDLNAEDRIAAENLLVKEYAKAQGSQQDLIKEAIDTLRGVMKTAHVHKLVEAYLEKMGNPAEGKRIIHNICASGLGELACLYLIEKRDAAIRDQNIKAGALFSEVIDALNLSVMDLDSSIPAVYELENAIGKDAERGQIIEEQCAQGTTTNLAESYEKVEYSATKDSQKDRLQETVDSTEDLGRKAAQVYELAPQYVAATMERSAKKRERIIKKLYDMDAVHLLTKILSEEHEVAKHNKDSEGIEKMQKALNAIAKDEKVLKAGAKDKVQNAVLNDSGKHTVLPDVSVKELVAVGAKTTIDSPQSGSTVKYTASMRKDKGIVPSILHMKGNSALISGDIDRGTA